MFRRSFLVLATLALLASSAPASAQSRARTVIVTLDATTLTDWAESGSTALRSTLDNGALAVVSVRSGPDQTAALRLGSAYATLGAGRRSGPAREGTPSALGTALARAGISAAVVAPAPVTAVAATALNGDATDVIATTSTARALTAIDAHDVTLIDPGITTAVEQTRDAGIGRPDPGRAGAVRRALDHLDGLLRGVAGRLRPPDLLLVLAPSAPLESGFTQIGVIAAVGDGFDRGLLSSGTTRRQGLIALSDVAPTILERYGLLPVDGMEGRAIQGHPRRGALGVLRSFERDLLIAARARHRFTRTLLGAALAVWLLTLLAVFRGWRGKASAARHVLAHAAMTIAAAPMALVLIPLVPGMTVARAGGVVIAMALAIGALAYGAWGWSRGMGAILAATASVVLIDLALGTPLASRSTLSFSPTAGARFWGIGNELMGVTVASIMLGAAMLLDRMREPRKAITVALAAMAVAVTLMGAPSVGGKFGAPLTAVPAFVAFAILASGRRITWRAVIVTGAATAAITISFILADLLRSPEVQAHTTRAVAEQTDLAAIIGRKIGAAWRLLIGSIWPRAAAVFALGVAAIARYRPGILPRALWGRPYLRAALWACGIGAVIAAGTNDAGLVAAALIALLASMTLAVTLLVPDAGEDTDGPHAAHTGDRRAHVVE